MKPPSEPSGITTPKMDLPHAWSKRSKVAAGAHRSPSKRVLLGAATLLMPFVLGGCQLPTFWGYRGSTSQGHSEFLLWSWMFIAALVVGGFVMALMLWSV